MNRSLPLGAAWLTDRAEAWPFWLAAAALALAGLAAGWLAPRWTREAEQHLEAVQRATTRHPEPVASPAMPAAAQPSLPSAAASPARAAGVLAEGRRLGLNVARVQEQMDPQGQLQLSLSGRAPYPVVRNFVARTLAADPALALDQVLLQRADAAAPQIDFELHITLLHAGAVRGAAVAPARRASP